MLKHIRYPILISFSPLVESSIFIHLKNEIGTDLQISSEDFLSLKFSFRNFCLFNKAGNSDINNRTLTGFSHIMYFANINFPEVGLSLEFS